MKAFVVAYHPSDESFHRAVLDRVLAGLRAGGAEVRVADLAAEGFRGELSLDEWRAYRTPLAPGDRADVDAHVDALRWCDTLVFVYPTWWSGQPAALTGWLDRVFGNGVAWSFPPGARRPQPLLGNIGRVVGVTTHGSSKLIERGPGRARQAGPQPGRARHVPGPAHPLHVAGDVRRGPFHARRAPGLPGPGGTATGRVPLSAFSRPVR